VSSLFTTILYMVKEMVAIHKFSRTLNIVTFLLFQLLLFLIYLSLMFISHPFILVNSSFRIVNPSMISLILISIVLLFRVVIRSTVPFISRFISVVLLFRVVIRLTVPFISRFINGVLSFSWFLNLFPLFHVWPVLSRHSVLWILLWFP
jgi:hypothetical protein